MDYSLIFCFDASTGKMHFCISQFSIVCTAACFLEHFISLVLESWFQRSFGDVALQHAVFVDSLTGVSSPHISKLSLHWNASGASAKQS